MFFFQPKILANFFFFFFVKPTNLVYRENFTYLFSEITLNKIIELLEYILVFIGNTGSNSEKKLFLFLFTNCFTVEKSLVTFPFLLLVS